MATEKEVKFSIDNFYTIRQILKEKSFKFVDRYFEQNLVFDFKDNRLKKQGKLLRLRTIRDRHILCFKTPIKEHSSNLKSMEEVETDVENRENVIIILKNLGLNISFRYEKIREKWKRESVVVCLDILPFGDYLEIESKDDIDIIEVVREIGLDPTKKDTRNYHEINREKRNEFGLPPDNNFVFEDWKRIRKNLNGVLEYGL